MTRLRLSLVIQVFCVYAQDLSFSCPENKSFKRKILEKKKDISLYILVTLNV